MVVPRVLLVVAAAAQLLLLLLGQALLALLRLLGALLLLASRPHHLQGIRSTFKPTDQFLLAGSFAASFGLGRRRNGFQCSVTSSDPNNLLSSLHKICPVCP